MKMLVTLSGKIHKIGLAADLHEVMNEIYYLDIKRDPILKVAKSFFKALRLYARYKVPELWTFLYGDTVKNRMLDAFSKKNRIDGETVQAELNSNKQFRDNYKFFNEVFQNHAVPPKHWLEPGTPEHSILTNHFKSERKLHNFKSTRRR